MDIRPVTTQDAAEACEVVRRSIIELCTADHHDDPVILERWLANKTPETVAMWFANPGNVNLVAVEAGVILAAGCVTLEAVITLNYVSPDARFRGVSRAMLNAMETIAARNGAGSCTLESTVTAQRFYRDAGYEPSGSTDRKHGLTTYPMIKTLAPLRQ